MIIFLVFGFRLLDFRKTEDDSCSPHERRSKVKEMPVEIPLAVMREGKYPQPYDAAYRPLNLEGSTKQLSLAVQHPKLISSGHAALML